MTVEYRIEPNQEQLKEAIALFEFIGLNTKLAFRVGINKTTKRTKTLVSTRIRENINVLKRDVDPTLTRIFATTNSLIGKIIIPARGLLLSHYATTAATPRVRVQTGGAIKPVKGKPSEVYPDSAFWGILSSGKRVILAPLLTPGPKGGRLKLFYGPSPSQVFASDIKTPELLQQASGIFTEELIDGMRYVVVKTYPPPES